ncbi:MAG: 4-hydroxy-tetrahydrodipicolinate synthase [Cellulomonas sp. 73-92]|uniref:4-hydroxy-tetrahydrodipicolinate synthase n=1 Tax=Cellulomonas sp. 73-92 TaxID=1895740 RepID=UPI000928957F|nr:4-hydroxy-tetrahydrodipicolinate synthase [Cellulomonas sp. 73-92]OJV79669.1 MAG: 4-hydroxy-tetrahydrodipicolinate synthase [Cellulomonas sp. 73-92]
MPPASTAARPFGSVLTAMVTPMTPDGAVDLDVAVTLAKHLVDAGNDGLVLNGTTGEAPTTHAPEKAELVAAVVEAVGDRAFVVAGAGSNDTAHAVRMAEQAAEAGAHGLLVVSPYYSRPSQAGLATHIETVAGSTDLPVLVYDIPGRAGVRIAPATFARLAEHRRIVGVKDAAGDVYGSAKVMRDTHLAYYAGDDGLFLALLACGGVGIISVAGHVVTPLLARVAESWFAGDTAGALAAFRTAAPAIDALNGAGQQAPTAKAALEMLGLIPSRATRLPITPLPDDELPALRAGLAAAGVIDLVAG